MAQSKVFIGVIWSSIQRFGTLGISFVSNMVLARLLTPDDFGTIGMLLFFIAIAQTFVDSGFGAALIQKKDITKEDINTVFYINMGMSTLAYAILFICAPIIANFYNTPILCELLRVQSFVVLIQGVTLIQAVQLQKKLDFKKLSICNLFGTIVLALSGIIAAYFGMGVWSLVVRTLSGSIATSALLWVVGKWSPSWCFSKRSFKELFGFGGFMLLSSIMITTAQNIQSMILGKMFLPSTLGNFTQARNLRNLSSESISMVINQVLYPDFSNNQNDNVQIRQKLEKSAYLISYIVCAIMAFMILCGTPLIYLLYGDQWSEAIPYFRIFCIGALPVCLQDININVIKAKGKSRSLFLLNFAKLVIYIVMMIVGAKIWGIFGFIWVMVIYALLGFMAFAYIGTRLIGSNIIGQFVIMGKSILLSSFPFCIVLAINHFFGISSYVAWLLIDAGAFFGLFIIISNITKCEPFIYLKNNLIIHKK